MMPGWHSNPEAFAELYRRHVRSIYRYHLAHTGNIKDAEDLTSQTFMAALEGIWAKRPNPLWVFMKGKDCRAYHPPVLYNKDMLSTRDARIARKVKRCLSEITPVKQLMVYGSRARGNPTKYSDLDLYIELETKVNPVLRKKIREIAWEVSLDSGVVITTLVASERLEGQPILKAIQAEGIAV